MDRSSNFLMQISMLYRATQRHYDRQLEQIGLSYAQLPILIMVYEQEGITMNQLAKQGQYDKGTISKSLAHLLNRGFVSIQPDQQDKRNKRVFTTDQAKQMMGQIYSIRSSWWKHLTNEFAEDELASFLDAHAKVTNQTEQEAQVDLQFYQVDFSDFSSWPHHACLHLKCAGCNLRCRMCEDHDLLFVQEGMVGIGANQLLDQLEQYEGLIDSVHIDGAQPLLQEGLADFLAELKLHGLQVSLATNGDNYDVLAGLVEDGLVDRIVLDLKADLAHLANAVGFELYDGSQLRQTISLMKSCQCESLVTIHLYHPIHTLSSIETMLNWVKGVDQVQLLVNGTKAIDPDLIAYQKDEVAHFEKDKEVVICESH